MVTKIRTSTNLLAPTVGRDGTHDRNQIRLQRLLLESHLERLSKSTVYEMPIREWVGRRNATSFGPSLSPIAVPFPTLSRPFAYNSLLLGQPNFGVANLPSHTRLYARFYPAAAGQCARSSGLHETQSPTPTILHIGQLLLLQLANSKHSSPNPHHLSLHSSKFF
ncbi:unnamed protein product [Protopolystoma xenopodis]|uniref:Uncharacterized protein n=1 Tax=Protopolystoma xenopodis TaxID=117903 RepID=A0A448XL19_9PLAT|nr:unnamed protein product [Protopolystoma xenopodis]